MKDSIKVSIVLPVTAKRLFEAWLDSKEHSKFSGGKAKINPHPGEGYSAWDGYISGKTLQLQPYGRIVQSWRTTDFKPTDKDSILEVLLEKVDKGTRMTILHTEIPNGKGKEYEEGWIKYYFEPMKKYFTNDKV